MSPEALSTIIAFAGILLSIAASFVVAHRKLNTERRLEIASYHAIRKLLMQNEWQLRSFKAIKGHLRGFGDDELRKLLVAAGAVAFRGFKGKELWGLLDRNKDRLAHLPFAREELEVDPTEQRTPRTRKQERAIGYRPHTAAVAAAPAATPVAMVPGRFTLQPPLVPPFGPPAVP